MRTTTATFKITIRCNDDTLTYSEHVDGTNGEAYAKLVQLEAQALNRGHRVEDAQYERVSDWRETFTPPYSFAPAGYPIIKTVTGWGFDRTAPIPGGFQNGAVYATREEALDMAWAHHEARAEIARFLEVSEHVPFLHDLGAEDCREIMARYFQGEPIFLLNCIAYTRAGHADAPIV